MFEKKITLKRVDELASELRAEMDVEINRVIEERQNTDNPEKVDWLFDLQHMLESQRSNITHFVHRIKEDVLYK
jgi:hypothetical protein